MSSVLKQKQIKVAFVGKKNEYRRKKIKKKVYFLALLAWAAVLLLMGFCGLRQNFLNKGSTCPVSNNTQDWICLCIYSYPLDLHYEKHVITEQRFSRYKSSWEPLMTVSSRSKCRRAWRQKWLEMLRANQIQIRWVPCDIPPHWIKMDSSSSDRLLPWNTPHLYRKQSCRHSFGAEWLLIKPNTDSKQTKQNSDLLRQKGANIFHCSSPVMWS